MQVNTISNYNVQTPNFQAHIPNTLGKKSADALAKKFLASNDSIKIDFANKYFAGIKKLENSKKIKEVICVSSDFYSVPYVKYDGKNSHFARFDNSIQEIQEKLSYKDRDAFEIMGIVIEDTKNLSEFIRENLR